MDAAAFRERARIEAERYGSDPWVFLRELLQNARDAGARRVDVTAVEEGGTARVACRDDGCGMSFEHARRYLFTLYASSKEGEPGAAGRFGVGFWSILRFDPARIRVRSWPERGAPWEVELDGGLACSQERVPPRGGRGTEIVLERPAGDGALARRVRDAVWQSARFLCRRDDPARPLAVRVNGEILAARFELPAPSARFRKGRVRGAVGLGPEARVELFAQGLRVRSASALEDLLAPEGASGETRVSFPAIADGVAPQAILDGDGLEPLLARSDVRETRALRRLVALAREELRRLVERQIDALRPEPALQRPLVKTAAVAAVAALAAVLAIGALHGLRPAARAEDPIAAAAAPPADGLGESARALGTARGPAPAGTAATGMAVVPAAPLEAVWPYRDLTILYRGPSTDAPEDTSARVALGYTPEDATPHFAALVLDDPLAAPVSGVVGSYRAEPCRAGCLDMSLAVADGPGVLHLPLPTGHRLASAMVRVGSRDLAVLASANDEPVLVLDSAVRAVVRYRSGPAEAAAPPAHPPARPLPEPLRAEADRLASLDPRRRVAEATAWVRRRIAYSTSAEVVERQRAALDAGEGLLPSALAIGAGDCDVQNAVLTLLLQGSGVPARMAVGYVGAGGRARAPLHAWVEHASLGGPWRVADASLEIVVPARPPDPLAGRETRPRASAAALAVAAALGVGLAALGFLHARPRREVRVDPRQDLASLIQGALQRPEAFRHAPALFQRKLVPRLPRGCVSLGEAWDLATASRLYASASGSRLARRIAARGGVVLDARQPEARAVADALAARDLDAWDAFLARARRTPLLAAADAELRRLGAAWEVRVASDVGTPAVLDLPGHGRIVVVDDAEPWLPGLEARFETEPKRAVFAAVDLLAEVVGLAADERGRLLGPLAREALTEADA
jgi:hypothetical protein